MAGEGPVAFANRAVLIGKSEAAGTDATVTRRADTQVQQMDDANVRVGVRQTSTPLADQARRKMKPTTRDVARSCRKREKGRLDKQNELSKEARLKTWHGASYRKDCAAFEPTRLNSSMGRTSRAHVSSLKD